MPLLNDQKWPRAAGRFPKANRTGRLPVTRGDSQGWNDDAGWEADGPVSTLSKQKQTQPSVDKFAGRNRCWFL